MNKLFWDRRSTALRLVSWNMQGADEENDAVWNYFLGLNADLACLQEVISIPSSVDEQYHVLHKPATRKNGKQQKFGTAILTNGISLEEVSCQTRLEWVNSEINRLDGCFVTATVRQSSDIVLKIMSVHSPAWPLDRTRLGRIDTSEIKLRQNKDVWGTELVWAMLRCQESPRGDWVVAGDFNASETFDHGNGGSRGNKEFLDRMAALGLTETLRAEAGELIPTFRNARGGRVIHQIDHIFVGERLHACLDKSVVPDQKEVFGPSLSDHLPIVSDFDMSKLTDCAHGAV